MTLCLYDTATRSVRPFVPLVPGKVSLYHCGATVQYLPHIGHLRGAGIVYDVLRRWLEYRGMEVTQVRNVTDIDDKILTKAAEAGRPWWEWATTYERAFSDAYDTLGCLRPSIEPRATGHIPQIQTLIGELIEAGRAYSACGDVYFAVRTQPDYGFLSGQRIDEMQQGESEGVCKRDPADFTLWKAAKPGEPSWDSPWGPGRPGWHIECTAMARTYLGDEFDIHGGGLDLVFPHHENEAAQAHGAELGFARYWMHSSWVTLAGEKMSKSLGNTLGVEVLTRAVAPIALRYYLVSVHYRSMIEYSPQALGDAARAFERIEAFLRRAAAHGDVPRAEVPAEFAAAMDDDLSVPRALAVVHDALRAGNSAAAGGDWDEALALARSIRGMLAVLGLDPFAAPWTPGAVEAGGGREGGGGDGATGDAGSVGAAAGSYMEMTADLRHTPGGVATRELAEATGALLRELLAERTAARQAKDFVAADAIRDRLARAGFAIEDTPDGPMWSVRPASERE